MRKFIAKSDDANAEIRSLEKKLNLPHGEFVENIDDANIRIEQLEAQLAAKYPTTATPTTAALPTTATVVHAFGLQRAIAGNQGKKTHIEPPKPSTGLQRAIDAAVRQQNAHHAAD
jgi:hypothetical protein